MQLSLSIGTSVVYSRELSSHGSDPHVQVGEVIGKDPYREEVLVKWPGILSLDQRHPTYRPKLKWVPIAHLTTLENSNEEA